MIYLRNLNKFSFIIRRKFSFSNSNSKFHLIDQFDKFSSSLILTISKEIQKEIYSITKQDDQRPLLNLNRPIRVGILCSTNYTYLTSLLAVWLCRGTAVPLNQSHPEALLDFYLNDSKCDLLITTTTTATTTNRWSIPQIRLDENRFYLECKQTVNESLDKEISSFKNNQSDDDAIIIYTSGTSNRPKGVIITHSNLHASIENLSHCWRLNENDTVLNCLPLNHVHGLVYCLLAPLFHNSKCILMPKFNPKQVWAYFLDRSCDVNIFSGVPTMYYKLLEEVVAIGNLKMKDELLNKFKLFASASAPLSTKLSDEWHKITGFRLIDRYGLSESSGLVLGNSVDSNVLGTVGRPGFNFNVRLVSQTGQILVESTHDVDKILTNDSSDLTGELEIKGPGLFRSYLDRLDQMREAFTRDGWFKTGDTAQYLPSTRAYKIVGRTNVDVIKSGGVKLSALEIESRLLAHTDVKDAVVIGVPDPKWGQLVMALLVVRDRFDRVAFLDWCKREMSGPSVPKLIEYVPKIERNQMGKVDKKALIRKYSH